jgi:hypothetical protein
VGRCARDRLVHRASFAASAPRRRLEGSLSIGPASQVYGYAVVNGTTQCDGSARRPVRSLLIEREAVMVRLFVRINVADFEAWRKVYDQFYGDRVTMGVMGAAAFQLVDDPNDVTVWHDFETAEVARAFVSSDALQNVMQRAGVEGEPQFWFTTESWRPAPSFA